MNIPFDSLTFEKDIGKVIYWKMRTKFVATQTKFEIKIRIDFLFSLFIFIVCFFFIVRWMLLFPNKKNRLRLTLQDDLHFLALHCGISSPYVVKTPTSSLAFFITMFSSDRPTNTFALEKKQINSNSEVMSVLKRLSCLVH